jgi:Zn-dependent protease/CBS domain-containing protein
MSEKRNLLHGAIRLFTIHGIEIRLDYSWFIIFVLVTWSLAGQYFPQQYPEWPRVIYWTLGAVTSILFFISVLLHELAHSLVAQWRGIRVPRITLFIFGGAAQIAEEPKSAGDEFIMAFAGPAMSVVISLVSGLLWYLFRGTVTPLAALFGWLSMINVMLAVFNLIPGFPLDGGRVLRAMLWGMSRDLIKATRIAAAVGRAVAYCFILLGVYEVFLGKNRIFDGIWIAFIGWFLLQAATQSVRQQAFQLLLAGHTAGEVMWTDCPFIDPRTAIADLVNHYILHTGRRCFPVVEDGRVSGIVTVHQVKGIPPEQWAATPVGAIMIPADSLKAAAPETPLTKIMEMMAGDGVNQVPVVRDGKFLGMVSREAVMEFLKTKSELGIR